MGVFTAAAKLAKVSKGGGGGPLRSSGFALIVTAAQSRSAATPGFLNHRDRLRPLERPSASSFPSPAIAGAAPVIEPGNQ